MKAKKKERKHDSYKVERTQYIYESLNATRVAEEKKIKLISIYVSRVRTAPHQP